MTGSEVTQVDPSGKTCKVTVKSKSGTQDLEAEIVLSAVGVSANLENIGLEETGVKTEKGRVMVDDYYQTRDRKSVVSGKSGSERVELGVSGIIKKKNNEMTVVNRIRSYNNRR